MVPRRLAGRLLPFWGRPQGSSGFSGPRAPCRLLGGLGLRFPGLVPASAGEGPLGSSGVFGPPGTAARAHSLADSVGLGRSPGLLGSSRSRVFGLPESSHGMSRRALPVWRSSRLLGRHPVLPLPPRCGSPPTPAGFGTPDLSPTSGVFGPAGAGPPPASKSPGRFPLQPCGLWGPLESFPSSPAGCGVPWDRPALSGRTGRSFPGTGLS